jgi:hypothetical protein
MEYKHTQIGYLTIAATAFVLVVFVLAQRAAALEPPSPDSGTNLLVTTIMTLTLLILSSFTTLTVLIENPFLEIKFGYGLFRKKFLLTDIIEVRAVKNRWYYGWGIRWWPRPRMRIYNVSGFDAVEIKTKDGLTHRIGTDEPEKLVAVIQST